jgi:DUF1680 family protein
LIAATFGPGKRQGTSGHPEIESALVELYRATGRSTYLDLAKYFIDQRGKGVMRGFGWMKAEYHQDRVPVRQSSIVEGHAVRAMYLNAGVTDLFLETGEEVLLAALDRQWHDMIGGKVFLTGGLGSRYEGEAFGDPYELPPDLCYCETCAAIGSVMWNWRMLLVTGEARFADLLEQTLYNGVLSGLALDGKHFFYINPLLSRGGYARQEWYQCACCPPNLMRLLASLAQYLVTTDDTGLQVHLYNTATVNAERPTPVSVAIQTDYPWQGLVKISIEKANGSDWQLRLRVPGWCSKSIVTINGQLVESPPIEAGYLVLERAWQPGDIVELALDMPANLIEPHPHIDAVRDCLAIQRGPIVYCLEAMDYPDIDLMDIRIEETSPLQTAWRDDLDLMVIRSSANELKKIDWHNRLYRNLARHDVSLDRQVPLTAIPYYAWGNRGANAMRVWIPVPQKTSRIR